MTSDSEIPPTAACTICTRTSSVDSFCSDCTSASCEPCTSALTISGSVCTSPSLICSSMVSSLAACCLASLTSRNLPRGTARSRAPCARPAAPALLAGGRNLGQALISTGMDGPASLVGLLFSSSIARTRPYALPASTTSPRLSVPLVTRMVAIGPLPLSSWASTTVPLAGASTGAFSSSTSACSSTCSSSSSTPVPILADTGTKGESPPYSSGKTCSATSSCLTRSGLASGLSILLIATTMGTPAASRARSLLGLGHHAVVGGHHRDDDVGCLGTARTHGGERPWPGCPEGDHATLGLDVVGTDMLRNAAGFARSHLGAADVVQQRGLAVVDVTHHGHHRRTRQLLGVGMLLADVQQGFRIVQLGGERLVAHFFHHDHGGFPVQHLVDGHHLAELHHLLDDLGCLDGHLVRRVGHRDSLGHRALRAPPARSARGNCCGCHRPAACHRGRADHRASHRHHRRNRRGSSGRHPSSCLRPAVDELPDFSTLPDFLSVVAAVVVVVAGFLSSFLASVPAGLTGLCRCRSARPSSSALRSDGAFSTRAGAFNICWMARASASAASRRYARHPARRAPCRRLPWHHRRPSAPRHARLTDGSSRPRPSCAPLPRQHRSPHGWPQPLPRPSPGEFGTAAFLGLQRFLPGPTFGLFALGGLAARLRFGFRRASSSAC